jgi:hypothetical protein
MNCVRNFGDRINSTTRLATSLCGGAFCMLAGAYAYMFSIPAAFTSAVIMVASVVSIAGFTWYAVLMPGGTHGPVMSQRFGIDKASAILCSNNINVFVGCTPKKSKIRLWYSVNIAPLRTRNMSIAKDDDTDRL